MKSISTALGFGESDKAQFRFHVISLLYDSGWQAVSKAFPNISRPTVYRWKKGYENSGKNLNSLVPKSTKPRNTRRMLTPDLILELLVALRKQYPRLGKAKLVPFIFEFSKANNLKPLKESTIGKVIKRNNLFFAPKNKVMRKRNLPDVKRIKLCPRISDVTPGYLQTDGIKFWYIDKYCYFLTAVEIVTKQAFVKLVKGVSSKQTKIFLEEVLKSSRVEIHTVQTDNGSEFKLFFDQALEDMRITHLFSYPRHPKTNGYVERFNWTVQDEFLFQHEDLLVYPDEFQKKLENWVIYYNQVRPHQSLNYLTPFKYQEQQGLCLKSV